MLINLKHFIYNKYTFDFFKYIFPMLFFSINNHLKFIILCYNNTILYYLYFYYFFVIPLLNFSLNLINNYYFSFLNNFFINFFICSFYHNLFFYYYKILFKNFIQISISNYIFHKFFYIKLISRIDHIIFAHIFV